MAVDEGLPEIKLHEITMREIRKGRQLVGPDIPMTVDVNCNWSVEHTRQTIPELSELNTRWFGGAHFSAEDYRTLAELRMEGHPIATGENACNAYQFREMCRLNATDFLQPSITTVGGLTEFLKIID